MDGSSRRTGVVFTAGGGVRYGARETLRRALAALTLGACLLPLSACSGFFVCDKTSCPSSGSGGSTTTGDYAYVSFTDTNGTSYLSAYNVASGALTLIKTITLPFVPVAVTVAPSNNFLYVASDPGYTSPGVYLYTIATDGSLTAPSGVSQTDTVGAMAMSADGKYLFTLSSLGQAMTQYSVDSTGTLSKAGALTVSSLSCALATTTPVSASCGIGTSPNNDFVVASFGTQGDYVFPYTSSGGITTTGAQPIAAGTASGDFSVAIDASDNAYIAQTSTMTVYGLTSTAVNNRGTISYASGSVPRSVTIGPSSKYVFTANQGTGTISSFTTGTTTALSSVSGSPFTGPAHVAALGVDNTGSYLVAVGYDATAGVQLFSISTTGVLASLKSAATSTATQYPVLVAMTH